MKLTYSTHFCLYILCASIQANEIEQSDRDTSRNGDLPSARSNLGFSSYDGKIFAFGGYGAEGNFFPNFWHLPRNTSNVARILSPKLNVCQMLSCVMHSKTRLYLSPWCNDQPFRSHYPIWKKTLSS